jgi:MFS superfamily sulfate permease-like transporter
MAGCVQIILSRLKVARFSAWFSPTVVEGMLASIGLLIIAKEFPDLIGVKFESHEFWGIVAEIPRQLMHMDPRVELIGAVCLGLTVALSASKARWTKIIPPPLIVVLVGLVLAQLRPLDPAHMLHIPDNLLKNGMKFPNFAGLFADRGLWWTVFTTVLTLTLIDGVESLATIAGIDKIDPYKRRSSPDRTLLAMGVSNILSSVAGGLTIIPGGVKSTTCIVTGGKTLWANFYNAVFLLMYLFLGKQIINLIPLSALAAIVVFIGYKLCRPDVWRHVAHVGSEQLLVFSTTVLVTVSTDLLLGIISGMVLEFVLNVSFAWPTARVAALAPAASGNVAVRTFSRFADLFRNPVTSRELVHDQYHLYFGRPLVSFNILHLNRELTRIPEQATIVYFHISDAVTLIDHTSSANLMSFAHDYEHSGKGRVEFTGLDEMAMCSSDETCLRLGNRALAGPSRGGLGVLLDKAARTLGNR